jgi:hypothetical protein
MSGWSGWRSFLTDLDDDDRRYPGVYQIRFIDFEGLPIPIPRIGGVDPRGIGYIGSSVNSALGRVRNFDMNQSSGGQSYYRVRRRLLSRSGFRDHDFEYRISRTARNDAEDIEGDEIRKYIDRFCEVPPFNSTVPGGK